jgi:GT2 family glycosyltransferase
MAQHFEHDNGPVIRGGRVELGNPADLDFTTKHSLQISRLGDIACVAGFILGCNMVFPRETFVRIGYFDERFGAGGLFRSGEETDLICRAYLAGIPLEYVPDMVVFHYHGRRKPDEIRKLHFDYCIGKGALYAKYCCTGRRLLRHLYWDSREAVFEILGGRTINRKFGLTYRQTIAGNFLGLLLYALNRGREVIRSMSKAITQTTKSLIRDSAA